MTFRESDLKFQFSDNEWQVKKFDTHRYFKILSGVGLKGIDFLGVYLEKQVVFFEVKNFHSNHPTKENNYLIFEDLSTFVEKVALKVEDTFTTINVISQYLLRKWWYRLFLKSSNWVPKALIQHKDWYFWYKIKILLDQKKEVIFVLWLEITSEDSTNNTRKLRESVESNLKKRLKAYRLMVILTCKNTPAFADSISVSLSNY